jgi:HAD superfamily hydrolase (TIGR01509 family)
MTRLVIFDCDGVLVDSEGISCRVLAEAIGRAGLPMSSDEARALFAGSTLEHVRSHVEEALKRPLEEGWLEAFDRERALAFDRELRAIEGAHDAVVAARSAGLQVCVASQARVEKTRMTLGLTGLLHLFDDKLYSAKMVPRPKPFPDLFLHAASQAGCLPSECVVVEDSIYGVRAAVAAGMRVFAYAAAGGEEQLRAEGGEVFHRMQDQERGELGQGVAYPGSGERTNLEAHDTDNVARFMCPPDCGMVTGRNETLARQRRT